MLGVRGRAIVRPHAPAHPLLVQHRPHSRLLGPTLAAALPARVRRGALVTAGTLAWPAADAEPVLEAWRRWTAELGSSVLTAVRIGAAEVSIDVAVLGDPWGAAQRLSGLRDLAPAVDTVATLDRRALAAPARLAAASAPVGDMPSATRADGRRRGHARRRLPRLARRRAARRRGDRRGRRGRSAARAGGRRPGGPGPAGARRRRPKGHARARKG